MKTRTENPDAWDALSPETYLSAIRAPVLLFQGDRDTDVPKEWSDHLAVRLREEGKDITYIEYTGERHEFGSKWTDFMKKSAAFFKEHLSAVK
jgi:dipeptidyl aminopeptidase/acylaminoacyl peptidase